MTLILLVVMIFFSVRPLFIGLMSGFVYIKNSDFKTFSVFALVCLTFLIPFLILLCACIIFSGNEVYPFAFALCIYFAILSIGELIGYFLNFPQSIRCVNLRILKPAINSGAIAYPFIWVNFGDQLALFFNIKWIF